MSFKTIHVLTADAHHHHACEHSHESIPSEDSEDCFVCDWTFPVFRESESVSAEFFTPRAEVRHAFGYLAPQSGLPECLSRNKAPPGC